MLTPRKMRQVFDASDSEDLRIEGAVDRVYAIARDKGTPGDKSASIAREQKRRMERARGAGDRVASGIRRADALKMRSRDDIATRKRLRKEASEASALAAYEDLKRIKRELDACDRAIARASGKTRRELKNQRRAIKHRYDLAYGTLARIDRSLMRQGDIPTPFDRPINGDYGKVLAYFDRPIDAACHPVTREDALNIRAFARLVQLARAACHPVTREDALNIRAFTRLVQLARAACHPVTREDALDSDAFSRRISFTTRFFMG